MLWAFSFYTWWRPFALDLSKSCSRFEQDFAPTLLENEATHFALFQSKIVTVASLFLCYIVEFVPILGFALESYKVPPQLHMVKAHILHCVPKTTHFPMVLSTDLSSALPFTLFTRVSYLFHHFKPHFPHFSCDQFPCTMIHGIQYY